MKPSTGTFITTAGVITSTLVLSVLSFPTSFIFYMCVCWGILRTIVILGSFANSNTVSITKASVFFGAASIISLLSSWLMSTTPLLSVSEIYGPLFFLLLFVFSLDIKDNLSIKYTVKTRQNYIVSVIVILSILSIQLLVNVFPSISVNHSDKPLIALLLIILLLMLVKPLLRKRFTVSYFTSFITSSVLQNKQIRFMLFIMLLMSLVVITTVESIQYVSSSIPFYEGLQVWYSTWKETIFQLLIGTSPSEYSNSFYKFHSISFNDTVYWNMVIQHASSFIAQIGTTTGLLGLVAFTIAVASSYTSLHASTLSKVCMLLLTVSVLFSPPSLILIPIIAILSQNSVAKDTTVLPKAQYIISIIGILGAITIGGFVILLGLADILYYSSISLLNQGKGTQALDVIAQAIAIAPYKPHYYAASSRMYQDAYLMLTKIDGQYNPDDYWQLSLSTAKRATEIAPEHPQTWEHLGQIYSLVSSSDPSVAVWQLASYQQAIKYHPKSPLLFISLGDVYANQGNYDEAKSAYEESLNLKKDYSTGYYRLAIYYEQQSNWRQSVEYYTRTHLLLDPYSPERVVIEGKIDELEYYLPALKGQEEQGDFSLPAIPE